jgi:hypothetical protein
MIFVNVSSTWSMVALETRFGTWITRNVVNDVSLIHLFLFNNTFGLPLLTMGTKCPNQIFYVWLVDLQNISAKYWHETWNLQKWYSCMLLDMKHCWNENTFRDVNTRNDVNGVCFFHLSYLIIFMPYLCWQRTTNFQMEYFMFD